MFASPQKIAEANKHPLNRAALAQLKEAKVSNPEGDDLHLLALARWGLEQGVWPANRDAHQNYLLEQQVGLMGAWDPRNVLKWLVNNPDGPDDPKEQMQTLRDLLEDAGEPEDAAANLLEWMGDRMQAGGVSAFQNPESELP